MDGREMAMTLTLYMVRHGQTDYSLGNKFCGSIDPPLNATGLAMAEAIGARYGSHPWAAIYASPRLRTRQTAAPTARGAGIEVQIEDGLREIEYGEWEGRAEADVERAEAERFHAWAAHPGRVSPPGGETAVEIAARALAAVDAIRARHASGEVLLVSHKATLRVLLCALLGIDVDLFRARIAQPVGAISVVSFKKSGPMVERLGDVSHLPPELLESDGT
jgi:broad specificity phosphatase PhoE